MTEIDDAIKRNEIQTAVTAIHLAGLRGTLLDTIQFYRDARVPLQDIVDALESVAEGLVEEIETAAGAALREEWESLPRLEPEDGNGTEGRFG
jgi:hypothetical protein